jgi:hypothetical protein
MNSAQLFKEYFEASFNKEADQPRAMKLSSDFFDDFIQFTPIKLEMLQSYLTAGNIDFFYNSLADLKYLVEFSDNLTRYWYLLRGYSGALAKLKADKTVKGSKKLFSYYFNKYGDRRILRNEHWFEKKRWEFMDELQLIYTEDELEKFILKYQKVLSEYLEIYISFMMMFIRDLKNLQSPSIIPTEIESKTL